MAVSYRLTTRNGRLSQVVTDAGATAFLQFWNGAIPATPITAPAGTLLASCAMSATIGTVSAGVLTMSAISNDASANASGTPTFVRISTTETGTTTGVAQMTAGLSASDVNISAAIVATGIVAVSSLTINDASE